MPSVNFVNEHKSVDVLPGANLRKVALKSGVQLYSPLHRVFHLNLNAGPLSFPCSSDVVEIVEGKGVNARTPEEERLLAGRFIKRTITASHRLACQVQVNGDVSIKTLVSRGVDLPATKASLGFAAVAAVFLLLMIGMFGMMALDLVKIL